MAAWASTREHQGKFTVRDADTQHCTHIVYAFLGLNQTTSTVQSLNTLIDFPEDGKGRGNKFLVE